MNILIWIVTGLIAGWLTGMVMKGRGYGILGDLIIGLLGSVIGGWLLGPVGGGRKELGGAGWHFFCRRPGPGGSRPAAAASLGKSNVALFR